MNLATFRAHLEERQVAPERIERFVTAAAAFERFTDSRTASTDRPDPDPSAGPPPDRPLPSPEELRAYAADLVSRGANDQETFIGLASYFHFRHAHDAFVAVVEFLDGSEALARLHIRSDSLPVLPDEPHLEDRRKFLAAGSLDEFLRRRRAEQVAHLERLMREDKLHFTQPITPEVIEFVRNRPDVAGGVRLGRRLIETKIPYMTRDYLAATNDRERQYYYCHCPWVRDALRTGSAQVSPTFCQCSAGFHKHYWEVVLGCPLQAEVVETVLQGDPWCSFAIRLPDEFVPEDERAA